MTGIIAQNVARTSGLIKAASGGGGGTWTKIATSTASSSATISFTSDIDSTYPIYCFEFINVHPATDNITFDVNFRDGGSAFDAPKTTTFFRAYHNESTDNYNFQYRTGDDLAQGTGVQALGPCGNDNDQCISGYLFLYSPSSTTYVKHFIANTNVAEEDDHTVNSFISGYCNVTAAIDGIQFTMESGNIDSGLFKMYGIKDS